MTSIIRQVWYDILLILRALLWIFRRFIKVIIKIWCKIKKSINQRALSRKALTYLSKNEEKPLLANNKTVPCRSVKDKCCVNIPPENRAMPDPYIYSQHWLKLRGLAYTWNNPDFKLIDIETGFEADNRNLKPNTNYRIEATIHNHSTMAAINTRVDFETRSFGISGGLISGPGFDMVDVPAAGLVVSKVNWKTPGDIGHICLIAKVSHPDDANSLNNKGQHNTNIVNSDNPVSTNFVVQNEHKADRKIAFKTDGYRLPLRPMKAKNFDQMRTKSYLERLKKENNPKDFLLPDQLKVNIKNELGENVIDSQVLIKPGESKMFKLVFEKEHIEDGQYINIHGIEEGGMLMGGVTFIINKQ